MIVSFLQQEENAKCVSLIKEKITYGVVGTPALSMMALEWALSPIDKIAEEGGPINVTPASRTVLANAEFSERNPYPGCIPCVPVCIAMSST